MKLISIVVPVYNEEENIEHFYEEICKTMQPLGYNFELLFVDDGSKDSSILILEDVYKRQVQLQRQQHSLLQMQQRQFLL